MGDYLGINIYLILICIGFTYTAYLTKNKNIRTIYKLRVMCTYLLFLAGFYLYFMVRYHMEPSSRDILMQEIFFKYRMGTVGTYLFYLASGFEYSYLITGFLTLLVLAFITIVGIREIRIAMRERKEKKLKEIEEEKIRNMIAIKEKLEREEKEKRQRYEEAREQAIREKINEILPEGKYEIDTGFEIS